MRHHRKRLGDKFSEGARLLWVALGTRTIAEVERSLKWPRGKLSNLLYGERGAGRKTSTTLYHEHGIPIEAWDLPPSTTFIPPAAREEEETRDGAA